MTAPRALRTSRLVLRSLQHTDIPAIVRLAGAREVAAMTSDIPHPYTGEDAQNFLAHGRAEFSAGRSAIFAITIASQYSSGGPSESTSTGEFCGAVGLKITPAHQRAELGYWIGVPFWGRGYATEAAVCVLAFGFDTLGLHRIFAFHFAGNNKSKRVLEKIGMRHEGCTRGHILKWSRFIDLEIYGILAAEHRDRK